VQVAVDPGRWPRPGLRFRGGFPDSTGGPGLGTARYQAELLGDPAGPVRERAAAERIDRCLWWSRDVQRREELAERDGGRGQIIRGRQRRDLAREEGQGIAYARPLRMYTGVPGVGTSVWKNAAMCIGIRTQPWEAGRRGTWVSPWIA
jgi:hypothetical protein